jgi:hypothetical protein
MFGLKARDLPGRVATGAFILHSGLEKWKADEARAKALHSMAANAFPVLKDIPPSQFLKLLSASEIALGAVLLTPVVPGVLAGLGLTGFSGALIAMYARTPAMHKPGSIWPTHQGLGVSKDIWMVGIGLGMVIGALTDRDQAPG